MADGMDGGARGGERTWHFLKKDRSKVICVVLVYFSGQATVHVHCHQQHSSQERPTKILDAPL